MWKNELPRRFSCNIRLVFLPCHQRSLPKVPGHQSHIEMTAAARLLEKRKEMMEAERSLQQAKEEFDTKSKTVNERRGELIRKEKQLKDALFKFDKFLKVK